MKTTEQLNIQEILSYLPHRYPFILIDRVVSLEISKRITAIKNVTINEPFFTGHFPSRPIMPGVLILEALAQATVVLANKSSDDPNQNKKLHLFVGIDNARFKQVVVPGDQLRLEVEILRSKKNIWKMHGDAFVGDSLVCSADLMSATQEPH